MIRSCVVRQPDGRYALFSREVQNFTHLNLSLDDLLVVCEAFAFSTVWVNRQVRRPTLWHVACRARDTFQKTRHRDDFPHA